MTDGIFTECQRFYFWTFWQQVQSSAHKVLICSEHQGTIWQVVPAQVSDKTLCNDGTKWNPYLDKLQHPKRTLCAVFYGHHGIGTIWTNCDTPVYQKDTLWPISPICFPGFLLKANFLQKIVNVEVRCPVHPVTSLPPSADAATIFIHILGGKGTLGSNLSSG